MTNINELKSIISGKTLNESAAKPNWSQVGTWTKDLFEKARMARESVSEREANSVREALSEVIDSLDGIMVGLAKSKSIKVTRFLQKAKEEMMLLDLGSQPPEDLE